MASILTPNRLGTARSTSVALLLAGMIPTLASAMSSIQEPEPIPGAVPGPQRGAMRSSLERLDPIADGWETEAVQDELRTRLKAALKEGLAKASSPKLDALQHPGFQCGRLRPQALDTVYDDGAVKVLRASRSAAPKAAVYQGKDALRRAWRDLLASASNEAGDWRMELKLREVHGGAEGFAASLQMQLFASTPAGARQYNLRWSTQWEPPAAQAPLALLRLSVEGYEEVHTAQRAWFEDRTEAVFGREPAYRDQIRLGLPYWQSRIPASLGFAMLGHQGLAIGDVNGDDLEDIYLCQTGGLPNRLFLRTAEGGVREAAAEAGVDFLDVSRAALLIDFDNDGDRDLVTDLLTELVFLENDGKGHFTVRATLEAPETTSLAAADYDGDGRVDVYACGYLNPYDDEANPIPYHDANNGLPNVLLRNTGDFQFVDVTQAVGLDRNNRRYSFAAAWEDYDNDGDQDLYVANDFGRNNLYRNDSGQFVDVAAEAGVEDISAGMGVTWADVNQDGWMDLYVSNMFSSAGNRVAYQRRFQTEASHEVRAQYQRHARGNTLFLNQGDGSFLDASESGTSMGRWAWGSHFIELNNDGWPDLVVPNGFITNPKFDDL